MNPGKKLIDRATVAGEGQSMADELLKGIAERKKHGRFLIEISGLPFYFRYPASAHEFSVLFRTQTSAFIETVRAIEGGKKGGAPYQDALDAVGVLPDVDLVMAYAIHFWSYDGPVTEEDGRTWQHGKITIGQALRIVHGDPPLATEIHDTLGMMLGGGITVRCFGGVEQAKKNSESPGSASDTKQPSDTTGNTRTTSPRTRKTASATR